MMYSIDPDVKTMGARHMLDKYILHDAGLSLIDWTRTETLVTLLKEMMTGEHKDFVLQLDPERNSGMDHLIVSAQGIPGEYQRLLKRINDLENELVMWRHMPQNYMAPVYNLLEKANSKVDKDKEV